MIDRTPYYNEKGVISLPDRARAVLKYGRGWLSGMEAQYSLLPIMEKYLDRKYTLLRNGSLPGLDVTIPFLLVGPAGLFVLNTNNLTGIYRAKGDQWGTISGATFKQERIHLLTQTDLMAHAVQRYLQQEGRLDIPGVESALVFTNPAIHVDSIRPIVRVILCDGFEHFIISLSEATTVISPDLAQKVIDQVTNPSRQKSIDASPAAGYASPGMEDKLLDGHQDTSRPVQTLESSEVDDLTPTTGETPEPTYLQSRDVSQPAEDGYTSEWDAPAAPILEPDSSFPGSSLPWEIPPSREDVYESQPGMIPLQSDLDAEPGISPLPESLFPGFTRAASLESIHPVQEKKKPVSRRQWFILGGLALFWIILTSILLIIIIQDLL